MRVFTGMRCLINNSALPLCLMAKTCHTMNNSALENQILACWQQNASPWIDAIQHDAIASRRLVTNRAITECIVNLHPQSVLDIGCGEGWLTHTLCQHGIAATGVDATPSLIDFARTRREGTYHVLRYDQLTTVSAPARFDLAVCNFSLLGEESTEQVFSAVARLLKPSGFFVIQTLHPTSVDVAQLHEDGWRDGSWEGFSADFRNPAPWYFRTTATWLSLFTRHGFSQPEIIEPLHPQSGQPASLILTGQYSAQ